MLNKRFSLYDAYSYGFKIIFNNIPFFFTAMLLNALVLIFMLILLAGINYLYFKMIVVDDLFLLRNVILLSIFNSLSVVVFFNFLSVGWTKISLDLLDDKPVKYGYLFKYYYFIPRLLGVVVLAGFAILIGLCLLIIPGVIIYQRLRFAKYFVIDKNESVMQSLKSSWIMTKGSVGNLVGYTVLSIVFEALIPVLPLNSQTEVHLYRQINKKNNDLSLV